MRSLIAASFVVGALVGCATTSSTQPITGRSSGQLDGAKMAAVESAARWRGVHIIWVNPPRNP